MKYTVRVEEIMNNEIEIEAANEDEALHKASEMIRDGALETKFTEGINYWIQHDPVRETEDQIELLLDKLFSEDRSIVNYDLWQKYQRSSTLEDLNQRLEENETEMTDAEKEKALNLFEKWIECNDYFWSCYWGTMDDVIKEVKGE